MVIVKVPIRKSAQDLIDNTSKKTGKYRIQRSGYEYYQDTTKKLQNSKANRVVTTMTRRMPIQKRRVPGQQMIRQESVGKVTRFISGTSAPYAGGKGYASRGRPKGSFYKYTIPGVGPVDVFTHRKWLRSQQRLLAAKMQAQNPGLNYNEAIQQARRIPIQQTQNQPIQISQPQQIIQQQPLQQAQIQQQPQQFQQSQQFDDGWGLLRIKSPFSNMNANNGQAAAPVDPISNAQRPVGNQHTSYYSEPDFFSGKQVMKQRPNVGGFGLW